MAINEFENSADQSFLYKYHASGYYVLGQNKYPIEYSNFRSIVIDHDYTENNMPLMYTIMNLSTKVIDLIVKNKETGVFILNIQKSQDSSDNSELWVDYINDTFVYMIADDVNKTDSRDYENANEGREDIYKEITVGLLSQNLINNNKKVVNGILNCNSMTSAIYYALGNRPIVLEPLQNNNQQQNSGTQNNNQNQAKQESYYSYIYNKYLTEMDIKSAPANDGAAGQENTNNPNPKEAYKTTQGDTDEQVKNSKDAGSVITGRMNIYMNVCKQVLTAKMTAINYAHKEMLDLMRAIVKGRLGDSADIELKPQNGNNNGN